MRALFSLAGALGLCVAGISSAQEANRLLAPDLTVSASAVNNQELANAVAAQLQKCGLRGFTIDIACKDGVVELHGQVADKAQHDLVVRSALMVPGVKNVIDNMMISGQDVRPIQAVTPGEPGVLPPPAGAHPIVDPIPVGQPGILMNDLNPPKMPPYAWPSYAPYNNYSRVAYPTAYPYNAWPYIGPFYPFPKVPLGWRSVTLEWQDGHWWMGRNGKSHDYWRVRYW
ncbi:MAG TPA: BON domain-containing protein [Gemmataceae bacterium]|nr:BON domain-containing protein [Gemmataceae bacterium]